MTPDLFNYRAQVERVVDGDTAVLTIDCGFKIYHKLSCRLTSINAPELTSTDPATRTLAQASKAALQAQIDGKDVLIKSTKLDNYGRPLVHIYVGDVDVNKFMVDNGFAVPYMV